MIADAPNKVIDKGLADAGLLAEIAVQKFGEHLPLHRQEQIFARDGVHLPRSTMEAQKSFSAGVSWPCGS